MLDAAARLPAVDGSQLTNVPLPPAVWTRTLSTDGTTYVSVPVATTDRVVLGDVSDDGSTLFQVYVSDGVAGQFRSGFFVAYLGGGSAGVFADDSNNNVILCNGGNAIVATGPSSLDGGLLQTNGLGGLLCNSVLSSFATDGTACSIASGPGFWNLTIGNDPTGQYAGPVITIDNGVDGTAGGVTITGVYDVTDGSVPPSITILPPTTIESFGPSIQLTGPLERQWQRRGLCGPSCP